MLAPCEEEEEVLSGEVESLIGALFEAEVLSFPWLSQAVSAKAARTKSRALVFLINDILLYKE